jgi:hypothetical protein
MTSFVNPLGRQRPNGFSARVSEIKAWTKEALSLDEEAVVSVNEVACSQPDCPPKQVVVLILCASAPARKFAVHKPLMETGQEEIIDAISALEVCSASRFENRFD